MQDLRFAVRSLSKSPGFAIATILTLAIAIGANTAMFSILYAVVLQPLAFRDPARVVRVWQTDPHNDSFREGASMPDLVDWRKQQRVFSGIAGSSSRMLNLTDPNAETERVSTMGVSHDFFPMLGVAPLVGRGFVAADDREGAEPVALISDALWKRRFGGGPIIGTTITLDGKAFEIVGVMPRDTAAQPGTDIFIPLTISVAPFGDVRGVHNVYVLARLKEGVTVQQAQAEMSVISTRLEQQYPDDNKGRGALVEVMQESMVRDARPRLYLLSAAVLAVLLIACINVAGLMLARADTRVRELAIRASLGASRARIVRQLLTESVAIAAAGGALGILFAWWATRTFIALAPALPRTEGIGMHLPVLLFALAATFLSAVLFGIIPAIRTSAVQPALALGGTRGVLRGTRTAGRGLLVIVEVALAVLLVIGAGLLLESLSRLMAVDVGLHTGNVVAFSMKLPEAKYPMPPRENYPRWPEATNFYDALLEQLKSVPGVSRAALGMNHPLSMGFTSQIEIVGQPSGEGPRDEVRIRAVTPDYFDTLGIPLLRGRALSRDDRTTTPSVIVINDALAQHYFRGVDPIGRQLTFWGKPRTIVGVVKGERFGGPQSAPEPALYPPLTQLPMSDVTLVVRASDPAAVISAVRATMRTLDQDIALYDVETLDDTLGRTLATPRFQAVLITSFGLIALLLAAIGLYALIAYQVQQRTNEIGIRLALGATRAEIARLILKRAFALALTGIAAGLAGALATGRFLKAIVFEVSTTDPAIYVVVPLLLVIIALIATWIPTRRAIRLDPAVALHVE